MRLGSALAVMVALTGPAMAQTAPHPGTNQPASVPVLTARIAWLGSVCTGYSLGYARHAGTSSEAARGEIADLASETGIAQDAISQLAEVRALEFETLLNIVLSAPDPGRNAPAPFATLLRYGQSDCQDLERTRNEMDIGLRSGRLPEEAPPPPLRAALLPDPDVAYRAERVTFLIEAMLDNLAAGEEISENLLTSYAIFTNDAPLPEAMEPGMATGPSDLAYWATRGAPPVIADITRADLIAIVQHIQATYGYHNTQHYMDLFVSNTPYGARDLITGPHLNSNPNPTVEEIVAMALGD